MPDPTFVPGSLGTVTFDTDPIITGQTLNFQRTKNVLQKAVIGTPAGYAIPGQLTGTFSVSGHVSVEQLPELETSFAKTTPVPFTIQVGDAAGATDGGLYTGSCVFHTLGVEVSGDGEWEYSVECATTGLPVYTPPTP